MDLHEIVKRLVGPINPTGMYSVDQAHKENMMAMINLHSKLTRDIEFSSRYSDSYENSVKEIGVMAKDYLDDLTNTE